nr:MAG TPA: hypothetical protein [Caudoviricetes sp.]
MISMLRINLLLNKFLASDRAIGCLFVFIRVYIIVTK